MEGDRADVSPLDPADPRFGGGTRGQPPRTLVESGGPGSSPLDPRVRRLRVLIPAAFFLAVAAVGAMFLAGLNPGDTVELIGPEADVRRAVAERPRRVCYRDSAPCAWLTVVDGELLALNTAGPLGEEYGRQGVGWCPSSGGFGANSTGSRFDAAGNVVRGPAPRGLDRFAVLTDARGVLRVDFSYLTTGVQAANATALPPDGPACERIPFDRDADLHLEG
jgi:hypothetical protein